MFEDIFVASCHARGRLIRIGEFSPVGQFFKITLLLAQISGLLFFHGRRFVLVLTKKLLGYPLGKFFTN
jgi:hypothetical protein